MGKLFSSIARGSVWVTASKIGARAFSLVSLWLVTATLSRTDYGVVVLALTVSGPVLVLGGLGLDDVMLAATSRLRGEGKKTDADFLLQAFAVIKAAVTATVILLLIPAPSLLGAKYQPILSSFLLPLQCWVGLSAIRTLLDTRLQSLERFGAVSMATVLETAGKLGALGVFFFVTGSLSVPAVVWAYVAGKVVALAPGLTAAASLWPRQGLRLPFRMYRDFIARQGLWAMAQSFVGSLFSGVDIWALGLIAGLDAVALYSLAVSMRSVVLQAVPFRQVLFPILSRMSVERDAASFVAQRMTKYSVWMGCLLAAIAAVVVPSVVQVFFPKYISAIPLFFFLLPSLVTNALGGGHAPLLYALKEQPFLFRLALGGTLSSLTVLPLLAWKFGPYGAALESYISTGFIAWAREMRVRGHGIRTVSFIDLVRIDDYDRNVIRRVTAEFRRRLHL